jgi:hypothetical protein
MNALPPELQFKILGQPNLQDDHNKDIRAWSCTCKGAWKIGSIDAFSEFLVTLLVGEFEAPFMRRIFDVVVYRTLKQTGTRRGAIRVLIGKQH